MQEFASVWDAIGRSPKEAANLQIRADLMIAIREMIRDQKWTQAEAAKQCRVSQPRINDLLTGKFHKFSLDALVNMAGALGKKVCIELRAA
jgi:predicted XRE-type DNA-binding protein